MPSIKIDTTLCAGCGICAKDCVYGCLKMEDGADGKRAVFSSPESCVGCGHCVAVCSNGAASFEDTAYTAATPQTDLERAIAFRRSVRVHKTEPLSHKEIRDMINIAKNCASAKGKFPLHYTVLHRKTCLQAAKMIAEPAGQNVELVLRGAQHMLVITALADTEYPSIEDAVIAGTTIELYAQSKGIGTFWCGRIARPARETPAIAAALRIPEKHKVLCCLGFGRSGIVYHRVAPRRDLDAVIHFVE